MNQPGRIGMIGGIVIAILVGLLLVLLLAVLMRAGVVGAAPLHSQAFQYTFNGAAFFYF